MERPGMTQTVLLFLYWLESFHQSLFLPMIDHCANLVHGRNGRRPFIVIHLIAIT